MARVIQPGGGDEPDHGQPIPGGRPARPGEIPKRRDLGASPEITPLPPAPAYMSDIGLMFSGMMKDPDQFITMLKVCFERRPNWIGRPIPRPPHMGLAPDTMTVAEAAVYEDKLFDAHPQDVARFMTELAAAGERKNGPLYGWAEVRGGSNVPHNQHYWGMPASLLVVPEKD